MSPSGRRRPSVIPRPGGIAALRTDQPSAAQRHIDDGRATGTGWERHACSDHAGQVEETLE
jgi:hypothetical protein